MLLELLPEPLPELWLELEPVPPLLLLLFVLLDEPELPVPTEPLPLAEPLPLTEPLPLLELPLEDGVWLLPLEFELGDE